MICRKRQQRPPVALSSRQTWQTWQHQHQPPNKVALILLLLLLRRRVHFEQSKMWQLRPTMRLVPTTMLLAPPTTVVRLGVQTMPLGRPTMLLRPTTMRSVPRRTTPVRLVRTILVRYSMRLVATATTVRLVATIHKPRAADSAVSAVLLLLLAVLHLRSVEVEVVVRQEEELFEDLLEELAALGERLMLSG